MSLVAEFILVTQDLHECGTLLLLQLFLYWLPHQALTCFCPCLLLEFHSRGKLGQIWWQTGLNPLHAYWIKLFIFSTHPAFVMLEFLFPCTLLYSCVLIKIANYLSIFLWEMKTSVSRQFFLLTFYFSNLELNQVDKGKLFLVLTKVQWTDAFTCGLLADGKYRSVLLEDHGGRLGFFPRFGSSCPS